MSLSTGLAQLNSALKTMRLRWEEAKLSWKDSVHHDFEEHYWLPLHDQLVTTIREMERLDQTLNQLQHDCQ